MFNKGLYNANLIAEYFVKKSQVDNCELSPLKLQKILYFAQGWSLVILNKPLFLERIEAWKYGPVIVSVYDSFKRYGSQDLRTIYDVTCDLSILDQDTKDLLDQVWDSYKSSSASDLVESTHLHDTWLESYNHDDNVISLESISKYFKILQNGGRR